MAGYKFRGTNFSTVDDAPARKKPAAMFDPSRCGTSANYVQHQRHGVPYCDPCRAARAEYGRALYGRHKQEPTRRKVQFNQSACGTHAGYVRHKRSDVDPCKPCLVAYAEYMDNYRKQRKAA